MDTPPKPNPEPPVFKKLTHIIAAAVIALWAFAMSPAGHALLQQYPKLAPIASGLCVLFSLYHEPNQASS